MPNNNEMWGDESEQGEMTVREAGQKGGEKTSETHGPEFYREIGEKGGQKVKRLVEEGKEAMGKDQ